MTNQPLYCQQCGSVLIDANEDGFFRGKCINCGEYTFRMHKVGIAAVIFKEGKLLLLERAQEPWKGYWNFPAGFLEYEESLEEGVRREVLEETGLNVKVLDQHLVVKYLDDPRGYGIVLFYDCEIINGEYAPNPEVTDMQFFSKEQLPANIASSCHQLMLDTLLIEGCFDD
jgi:ADP-ribose pyrophosphatase YjhB (NUDIX family)